MGIKQEISGIVGFAKDSDFFKSIKHLLKIEDLKLEVRIYENVI